MVEIETFRRWALSFPETTEQPHFHLTSFRFRKKIFATLRQEENRAMLKLSPIDQSVFCGHNETIFFPVPGSWGRKGATYVQLEKVRKDIFKDALHTAYQGVKGPEKITKTKSPKKSGL